MVDVKEAGKRGGDKTLKKHGKDFFKRINKLSQKVRQKPSKKYLKEISKVSKTVDSL